jgi:hypothetical protein
MGDDLHLKSRTMFSDHADTHARCSYGEIKIPEAKVTAFAGQLDKIRPATVITLASHFPQSKEEEGL